MRSRLSVTMASVAALTASLLMSLALSGCRDAGVPKLDEQAIAPTADPARWLELSDVLRTAGATTLSTLVEERGIDRGGSEPFTLLAPSDEAFVSLDPDALASLLANDEQMRSLLRLHTLDGRVMLDDMLASESVTLGDGSVLPVATRSSGAGIGETTFLQTDLTVGPVVVHVIDRFLAEVDDERLDE